MMVECYSPLDKIMGYYGNKSSPGSHFPFNFLFITEFNQQSDVDKIYYLIKFWMTSMPEFGWANWVVSNRKLRIVGNTARTKTVSDVST